MKPTFIALLALCLCLPVIGADKKKPGTVLWEFQTGGYVKSSPAIGSDGTVYVGSGSLDKKLYAIKTDYQRPSQKPVAHTWAECAAYGACDEMSGGNAFHVVPFSLNQLKPRWYWPLPLKLKENPS